VCVIVCAHLLGARKQVLPRLLRSFFAPEPMLLFVLGHFARQSRVRDVTARIMCVLCARARALID
jgi:hypothetical protein